MKSTAMYRLLSRIPSAIQSSKVICNEQLIGNRYVFRLPYNGMHSAAAMQRTDLLKSDNLKRQQIEQKRYIWPFTKKGYCEMKIRQVDDLIIAKKSIILDCRRFDEVAKIGKIPFAEIVPVEELEEGFQLDAASFKNKYGFDKPDKHDQIVVYCRTGKRAASACYALVHLGYDHVCRYEGSWSEWSKKNVNH